MGDPISDSAIDIKDNSDSADDGASASTPGLLAFTPLTASMQHINSGEEAEPAAELGADMEEIRARVLGRRAKEAERVDSEAGVLTADENREVYDELKKRHQVDLNDEDNVSALEDPSLMAHMEGARRRLAEQERALLRLPRLENLRGDYLKTMGQISTLLRKLDDEHTAERESVESSYRQARVLGELTEGKKPHGYPALGAPVLADTGTMEALRTAEKEAAKIAKAHAGLLTLVETSKTTLFVLRRQVEAFGDGLIDLIEASEEDRRRLREFLAIASQSRAVQEISEPPDTLGEQILALPMLPEESGISATGGKPDD